MDATCGTPEKYTKLKQNFGRKYHEFDLTEHIKVDGMRI